MVVPSAVLIASRGERTPVSFSSFFSRWKMLLNACFMDMPKQRNWKKARANSNINAGSKNQNNEWKAP